MTTRTVERGRLKCGQYWPLEEGTSGEYGKISVANLEIETRRDYTITVLTVHNSTVRYFTIESVRKCQNAC